MAGSVTAERGHPVLVAWYASRARAQPRARGLIRAALRQGPTRRHTHQNLARRKLSVGESKRQIFDKVLGSLADGYETIASLIGEGTDEEYQLKLPRTALIEALIELIKSCHVKAVVFDQEAKKYE